jgi:pimeloyl-ACP methyl ester carboxylesterase
MSGASGETVVLVHGLWMFGWTLSWHARRLTTQGFRAAIFRYRSVRGDLDANARRLAAFSRAQPGAVLHYVGHSLGGLVTLRMLALDPDPRAGRVVLMGSPYNDSAAMRAFARWPGGRRALGRCLPAWYRGDRPDLGRRYEIGVIAGCRGVGAGRLLARLPVPHDGTVAAVETRLPSMTDYVELPVTHTSMLVSGVAARAVCAFLRTGRFGRVNGSGA